MSKQEIMGISSAAVMYRAANPAQIFLEMKDDGYPLKMMRRKLFFIGGNWIGEDAKTDQGPLDTVRREITEEISLEHPARDRNELTLMGWLVDTSETPEYAPAARDSASTDDALRLKEIKRALCENLAPFDTSKVTITQKAMLLADPDCKKETFTTVICCWVIPLGEDVWSNLARLQQKYGNISNESVSMIVSLNRIIERNVYTCPGQDQTLQRFFRAMGLPRSCELPLTEHCETEWLGPALASYDEYLEIYDVERKP